MLNLMNFMVETQGADVNFIVTAGCEQTDHPEQPGEIPHCSAIEAADLEAILTACGTW